MSIEGKVAIVSGANGGIGRAVVDRLSADGALVVAADLSNSPGTAESWPARTDFVHCDVTNRSNVRAVIDFCMTKYGKIDICVNCAAVLRSDDFLSLREDDLRRVLDVNVVGSFLMGQLAAEAMVKTEIAGAIVNFSSVIGQIVGPDQAAYAASKGAVEQLTRVMAVALAPHGIRVNAVGPGVTDTPMLAQVMTNEAAKARILSRTPLGRAAQPREVAAVVKFLASDEASYVTGQTYYVDGGRLSLNYMMPGA